MKFCGNCGKELSGAGRFCNSCGAPVEQMEETASSLEYVETRTIPKFNFSKKWVLITIAALVLIGGGTAVGMFFLNNSPKELFLLSEYNSYQQMADDWNTMYGDDLAFQEKLLESPSSSEIKLSGNLDLDEGNMDYQEEMLLELLKQSAITIKTNQDPIKQANHSTVALNIDGTKALDVEYVQTKKQAGLKIPKIYDQFFYLNFNQYGEFMRKVNPYYQGPETLEINTLQWNELKLSEKEKESLTKRYSKFLLTAMKEENFTLKKGVKFDHEGESLSLREITFKLSPAETNAFINSFLDQLIKDDELQKLITDRVVKVAKAASLDDQVGKDLTDKAYVKEELISGLKELKKEMNRLNYPDGFKYVLLIDKNKQIIDRKINFAVGENKEFAKFVIETKHVPLNNNKIFEEVSIGIAPKDAAEGKMELRYTNTITKDKEIRKEDVKVLFTFENRGDIESKVDFTMNSLFKGKSASKQTVERDFNLRLGGDQFRDVPAFKGSIYQTKDISLKDKYSNQKFDIKLNVQDVPSPGIISLTVDAKTKLKESIKLPSLNAGEGKNVAELTDDDINEILFEMENSMEGILEDFGLADY
ncbi:zinc ribbon domain-containing protein [Neobacillus novalis]|uniref:Zinc ribbon domain-containing protein n=1 Tax=Neobacillus novalis TaxID=220687 RepID=A0AA95MUB7_9BACI|nr:zinc ribbon domain-containing protein [Neobacillus novalis]WHY87501.1 zinc ribbon domain-containing protein [Neobacillus novalis]